MTTSNGLYGKCLPCGHVFLIAKLPMELTKAAELAMRAACSMCGEIKGIAVASEREQEGRGGD